MVEHSKDLNGNIVFLIYSSISITQDKMCCMLPESLT